MFGKKITGDVTNSKSSTNRAHLCVCESHWTHLISGWVQIAIARVSIAIAKIRGERRQPCLVSLAILMGSE